MTKRAIDSQRISVVSVSTLYPNPREPLKGQFVRHRLLAASHLERIRLIAPVQLSVPTAGQWMQDGGLTFRHQKWLRLPGLAATAPRLLAAQLVRLVKKADEESKIDLLDAQFGFPDGPAVARVASVLGLPYAITLRGSEVLHATYPMRYREIENALRNANAVIAVSKNLRQFALDTGVDPKRAVIIPNGIDRQVFYPQDRAKCRLEWRIRSTDFALLAAGNLIRLKGFDRLIRSIAYLAQTRLPQIKLFIAGPGGIEEAFESSLRELPSKLGISDKVVFCGPLLQDQLARLMNAADVFVLASEREGWPNVVNEALACGTPVIATDVGAVRDLLSEEGSGIIVPSNDQSALSEAIAEANTILWDREAISKLASSRGWAAVAEELSQLWRYSVART